MRVAIPIFEGFTALDAIGPYEVLSRLPGAEVTFVAAELGLVRADSGMLRLDAEATLEQAPLPDVLVVPGGRGTRALLEDEQMLSWLRVTHEQSSWTTSVCTGSLLLAAAGVLAGVRATTHWLELETLARLGAEPVAQRVVREGRIVTAAGVSAGIDMALTLAALIAGERTSQAIQLAIEYEPDPPFRAGSPSTAPQQIVDVVRSAAAGR